MTTKLQNTLPLAVLILIGLFIFTIGIRVNYTNIDEAYFVDPVINLLTGHGYTTTSWNITRQSETHVSTAPFYSCLLMVWLKIFGISQTAVRSLSAALVLSGAFVFWRACARAGLVKSGAAGAVLISVLVLDYGYAYSYSVGRPDALSALCVAALFYCFTLPNQRIALGVMGGMAVVLPFVQWGCVIYVGFLSVALLVLLGRKALLYVMVIGFGLAAGLLVQKTAYTHFNIWNTWMNTIKAERSERIANWIGNRLGLDLLINRHSNTIPKDFSALVVLAGMALIYIRSKFCRQPRGAQLAKAAWVIAGVVTLGMYLVGKFPTYYGWMLSLPLAAILASYCDLARQTGRIETVLVSLVVVLACGVGLPMQAALAARDWSERQPGSITAWLGPKISKDDVVYCDYPFYYIAKERSRVVFTGHYLKKMSDEDFTNLTVVIIGSHGSDWSQSERALNNKLVVGRWQPERVGWLGNDWQYGILSAPNYDCTVYRLKGRND